MAQTTLSGVIKDTDETPIPFANISIKKDSLKSIYDFTYADGEGKYSLSFDKNGTYTITYKNLGYETKTIVLEINLKAENETLDIILDEKSISLDEVIITPDRPIKIEKDTITFKTKYFTDGTEQTVEDLLKKIPGIQINSEGTIKVGNQEIEKLMVDGDDLFESGYKILSKNMPAYPIEEVELLKRFSNNRLLKGIEKSNKVALNLKLNEKAKRIWFGNVESALGNAAFYHLRGNLMNFGKKNKYYFLTHLNNIGLDATGDIEQLIRPYRYNEPASIGDNQQVNDLLSLSPSYINFKQERTHFNHAKLLSLNAIFNPTENTKIKTLGFFNGDVSDFYRNSSDFVNLNDLSFTNTEHYKMQNKKQVAFGKLDFSHDFSQNQMLETVTKYNSGRFDDGSHLDFNQISTLEDLKHQNRLFDQKVNYTNKFRDHKVFLLTGRFIDEKTPQNYHLNQFFYQDLFPNLRNSDQVKQNINNQMQYAGFNAHLMDKKENGSLLELQLGNEYRKDKLNTEFILLQRETTVDQPQGYQNLTEYQVNNLYLKSKYQYKLGDLSLVSRLDFHQLFNTLSQNSCTTTQQSPFFINPSIGLN